MDKDLRKEAASKLCLGSWHIFSRQTPGETTAFIGGALERGINHFDIGDYWDHDMLNTCRFREVMRSLGLPRESYRIGVKVFTTSTETRESVVSRLLELIGIDYADYVLCSRPNTHETLDEAAEKMDGLIKKGLARELDFSLWNAPQLREAYALMSARGMALPRFVQFQYSLCRRDVLESPEYYALFEETGMKLQAAFPLEGGILGGHVTRRRFEQENRERGDWFTPDERNIARDSGGIRDKIVREVPRLIEVARLNGMTAAQLSLAFAATHPYIENVLFGATKLWQLDEALAAVALALRDSAGIRALADEFRVSGSAAPKLFDFSAGIR